MKGLAWIGGGLLVAGMWAAGVQAAWHDLLLMGGAFLFVFLMALIIGGLCNAAAGSDAG